ncbi:site-2 protease family protein [Kitasatospora sp. NPDC005856]|uniref:site-2 protease family protein n=1 Tax=Kitasatospora sp. NPDC005856 TaxID=3154566 RepID=UPI0033D5F43E
MPDITVRALGGTTRCDQPASPKAALVIAVAGPATSPAVGVLALGTGAPLRPDANWTLVTALLAWLGGANLVLGVVNLLPAAPMDGGQILQAALWWRGADRAGVQQAADRAAQAVGLLLAAIGTALLLDGAGDGLWLMAVGLFLAASAAAERRRSVLESTLRGVRVADAMPWQPSALEGWFRSGRPRPCERALPDTDHAPGTTGPQTGAHRFCPSPPGS